MDFGSKFNSYPKIFNSDGDGTVNRRSLIGCDYWKNSPAQANHMIFQQEIPDVDHYNILSDSNSIDYILKLLINLY